MNKKALQIQTHYLEDDDEHSPIFTTSKINYEEKLEAATILEKTLSIILAKNFISCWRELKSHHPSSRGPNLHNKFNTNNLSLDAAHSIHQNRVQYLDSNARSQSQHRLMKASDNSGSQGNQRRNHRSVRVISQEIENSRANVLKQIVEKLKNVRKIEGSNHEEQTKNGEVLKKISLLEKMVRTMTNSNHREKQEASDATGKKKSQPKEQVEGGEGLEKQEEQMVKSFMQQIKKIREEIHEIKLNNEVILKSELQRSRASSNSGQNLSKHGDIKQTISEGVQTAQIPTKDPAPETKNNGNYDQAVRIRGQQKLEGSSKFGLIQTGTAQLSQFVSLHPEKQISKSHTSDQVKIFKKSSPINGVLSMNLGSQANGPTSFVDPASSFITKSVAQTNYQAVPISSQPSDFIPASLVSKSVLLPQTNQPPYWRSFPNQPPPQIPQNQPIQQALQQGPFLRSHQAPQIHFQIQPSQQLQSVPVSYKQPSQMNRIGVEGGLQFPRFDQIKTNTTFYSKNNVYSEATSSNSLGLNYQGQGGHYRNPSIQFHEGLGNASITFSNYCSACGRTCGCPRTHSQTKQFL